MKYAIATLSLLVVIAWGSWRWPPASFTLRNESGQSIRFLMVEVGGKTFRFEDIPAGSEVSGSFHVGQEESLDVRGELADSTRFSESCGYVVWEEFAPHINAVVRAEGWVGTP